MTTKEERKMPAIKQKHPDRFFGFKHFFAAIPASNDAHLKIELYDDNEPQNEDVQSVECWRHCGHDDMLYFSVSCWKSENGLVLNAENAKLLSDILLAYYEASLIKDTP